MKDLKRLPEIWQSLIKCIERKIEDICKYLWSGSLAGITAKHIYSHIMSLISCINSNVDAHIIPECYYIPCSYI